MNLVSVKDIVEAGLKAPSGDNCQPWRLVVDGNSIDIFNVPERDTSLFNHAQRASLIAHGALLENMAVASRALGYEIAVATFPDKANRDHVASVFLKKSKPKDEPLYPYIEKRTTNRKRYDSKPLSEEEKEVLLKASEPYAGCTLRLVEGKRKKTVCKAIGENDRIVFENRRLHRFLFDHIRWTEEEALRTRDGLHIKTLELPVMDTLGFRLLKKWKVTQCMNALGSSRMVARRARKLCRSAGALGLVAVRENAADGFLSAGRVFQRAWLEASRMGLSVQPMTGITFLIQKVLLGQTGGLSETHIESIRLAHKSVRSAFDVGLQIPTVLFRVGRAKPPSGKSLRIPGDDVVTFR
jgi:nitroreductase